MPAADASGDGLDRFGFWALGIGIGISFANLDTRKIVILYARVMLLSNNQ